MTENKRMKIFALKQAGHSSKYVVKMVSVDLKTVYKVMKSSNDKGTTVRKPKCGRKRTVCTKALVDLTKLLSLMFKI